MMASSLLLATLLVLASEFSSAAIMTNSWAVQIQNAGKEDADVLAEKHGFVNLGPVS